MKRRLSVNGPAARLNRTPLQRLFVNIRRISAEVPAHEWEKAPKDGSHNHDRYLVGARKK